MYFADVTDWKMGQKVFREPCKQYHPDTASSPAERIRKETKFKAVAAQWELWSYLHDPRKAEDRAAHQSKVWQVLQEYEELAQVQWEPTDEQVERVIDRLVNVPDVYGLWVPDEGMVIACGETYREKDSLKLLGFKWHSKYRVWRWEIQPTD